MIMRVRCPFLQIGINNNNNGSSSSSNRKYIGHVGKMSVSGCSDRQIKARLHKYVVSLSNTLPSLIRIVSVNSAVK